MPDVHDLLERAVADVEGRSLLTPAALHEHGHRRVTRRRRLVVVAAAVAALAVAVGVAAQRPGHHATPASPTPAARLLGTVVAMQSGVQDITVDPATGTVYAASDPPSVVDTAGCSGTAGRTCGPVSELFAGTGTPREPAAVVVDPTSHTLYLATGRGDIDVFDVRSCNARTHTECHAVRSIPLSRAVNGLVLDPATRTLYAAVGSGASGAVAVVDASACSATTIKSCDGAVRTVPVRGSPDAMAVDDSTNTLYVRVTDDSLASTVDVLGTARCNGFDVVACAVLASVPAGQGWTLPAPDGMALDPLTGTLYVTSFSDDRLSLLDASHCNAGDRSGCAAAPVTAAVGTGPIAVTVDPGRGRVFVLSYGDATLRLSGVARCRSGDASGCARGPMLPVDALPDAATLDPSTGTVYVGTSQGKTVVIVDVG